MYWIVIIGGILCCILGIYLFVKNVYEEGKTVMNAFMFMVLGVFLIGWATALLLGWVK
jgi:hypothetical protein